jgi:tryptophan-rich sensory protein
VTRSLLGFLAWLALTLLAASTGAMAARSSRVFYEQLDRPAWAPPGWLFGPVWGVLYLLMAIAAWRVWRARGWSGARGALGLNVAQLVVNALWSVCFFMWRDGPLATLDVVVLLALVLATIRAYARHDRTAAAMLAPYALWVGFATALTVAVWTRNPTLL